MVKELRTKTDLPMMECKQALSECDGDMGAANDWLRKKYKGKLADRTEKTTGEGRIGIWINESKTAGGIVQFECETAPVAKNEIFVGLADAFAAKVGQGSEDKPNPEDIRKDPELDATFTDVFGKMRENMNLAQAQRVQGGHVAFYVHHDGKSGVMLALDAEPKSDKNVAADLCMHAIFTKPMAIDRTGVPEAEVEKVRSLAIELAKGEGKPDEIVTMIVDGKVNAFYGDHVLMEQLHVKSDEYGKAKVVDILKAAGVNAVTNVVIMKIGA